MAHSTDLKFRPAQIEDADLLLKWRNDPLTRQASIHTDAVSRDSHMEWLRMSLASDIRKIWIVESGSLPVGTVRVDTSTDGSSTLSWTVAPDSRGKGYGKLMVRRAVQMVGGVIHATIYSHNESSIKIAQYAGLQLVSVKDGLMSWSTPTRQT